MTAAHTSSAEDPQAILVAAPPTAQQLVASCQGLVRSLAWKIHRKVACRTELEDLISYGQVGLVQAAQDFDPTRGQFTTYAYYRIRGAILDGLSKMSWFSFFEYHSQRYEQMADELLAESEQSAPPCGQTPLEDGARWFEETATSLSMTYVLSGLGGFDRSSRQSWVDDSEPDPLSTVSGQEICTRLRQLVDALPPETRTFIHAAYFEGTTLQEAGRRIGISRAWASRLHARVLKQLAKSLKAAGASE